MTGIVRPHGRGAVGKVSPLLRPEPLQGTRVLDIQRSISLLHTRDQIVTPVYLDQIISGECACRIQGVEIVGKVTNDLTDRLTISNKE